MYKNTLQEVNYRLRVGFCVVWTLLLIVFAMRIFGMDATYLGYILPTYALAVLVSYYFSDYYLKRINIHDSKEEKPETSGHIFVKFLGTGLIPLGVIYLSGCFCYWLFLYTKNLLSGDSLQGVVVSAGSLSTTESIIYLVLIAGIIVGVILQIWFSLRFIRPLFHTHAVALPQRVWGGVAGIVYLLTQVMVAVVVGFITFTVVDDLNHPTE